MSISQPSPDRLIFDSHSRSSRSVRVGYWIAIFVFLGEVGLSIFALGWLLSKILSQSFTLSYLVILNDLQFFLLIVFIITTLVIIASVFTYISLNIFTNTRITGICTFDRVTSHSHRPYAGEVSIEQRNILNQKKIVKIPLDKIVDLRLQYGIYAPMLTLQILLITDRSARPIIIGDLPYSFSKVKSQQLMQLMVEETDRIREFINLPLKPSYLVDGKSDYSVVPLARKSQNNYLRIFTSTNLATVREFSELVRSHLNSSDRAMSNLPNCESSAGGLTPIKF